MQVMNLPSLSGFIVVPLSFRNQPTSQSSWLVQALDVRHSAALYMTERHRQYQVVQLRDENYTILPTLRVSVLFGSVIVGIFVWFCSVTGTLEFSFCHRIMKLIIAQTYAANHCEYSVFTQPR